MLPISLAVSRLCCCTFCSLTLSLAFCGEPASIDTLLPFAVTVGHLSLFFRSHTAFLVNMDSADNSRPHHEISRSNLPPPPPPPLSSGQQATSDGSDLLMDEDGQGLPLDSSMINSTIRFDTTSTYTVLPNVLSSESPIQPGQESQAFQPLQSVQSVQESPQSSQVESSHEVKPERLNFDSPSPQPSPSPPVHLVPESPVKSPPETLVDSFDPLLKPSESVSPTPEVDLKLDTKSATPERLELDSPSPQPSPSPPVHVVPESPVKSASPLEDFDPIVQAAQATASPSAVDTKVDTTNKPQDTLDFLNDDEVSPQQSSSPQVQVVPDEPLVETNLDSFLKSSSHSVVPSQLDDKEGDISGATRRSDEKQPLGAAAVPSFPGTTGGAFAADSFLSSLPASHFDQQPANPQLLNKEESHSTLRASDTSRTSASMSSESTSANVSSSSCSCPWVMGK